MAEPQKKEELVKELQGVGLPTEGTKEVLEERLVEYREGDIHVPERFAARFDPLDPPDEDPGPAYRV